MRGDITLIVKRKNVIAILMNIVVFLFYLLLLLLNWNIEGVSSDWVITISYLALFLLAYQAVVMIGILKVKYTDFLLWFILLEFIFLYGRIWVKALGKDDLVAWHLFNAFDDLTCYKAALFCLAYSQAIFFGSFLFENSVSERKMKRSLENYSPMLLYKIGWVFFALTFPVKLYSNLIMIAAQKVAGDYVATGITNGLVGAISYLPVIGLIIILCSQVLSRTKVRRLFYIYLAYEVFYMVFSGDRRQDFIGIITWTLCYMQIYNVKMNLRKIVKYVLAAFIVLIFLATIRTGRSDGFNGINSFFELFEQVAQNDLLVETLGEFGGTFFTVTNVIKYYPERLFFLGGLSLLGSLLIVVPGIMTSLFPKLFYYTEINYRCKDFNGLATGGSLPQDMYANWGLWGVFFAIIAGVIIAKVMTRDDENLSPYETAMYYARFYIFMNLVRAGTIELGRPLVYTYVLVYLLGYVLRDKGRKE